jgi:hypothetical protein
VKLSENNGFINTTAFSKERCGIAESWLQIVVGNDELARHLK